MNPHQYCQQKTVQSGSSFYYSFMLLKPERRQAMNALYAFCREVDDIVDDCQDPSVAAAQLSWWHQEVDVIVSGKATHPVTQALQEVVPRFVLPIDLFHEIICGMEMDLSQHRYADFEQLQHYCYRVASVVGLLSARIFGYQQPQTLDYAADLGVALQLTNIIRDVGEDIRRGRIYLPVDELARFEVSAQMLKNAEYCPAFVELMRFQYLRAESFYQQALARLPREERDTQRPGLVMAKIYRTLLAEIAKDNFQVLDRKTSLTPIRKLWLAASVWLRG